MAKLKNKVAVITGGTSGIGYATAQDFINEGATVIITGRFQNTVDETVQKLGINAKGIVSDAGKTEDVFKLAEQVKAISPKIDIVFPNAGYGKFIPIDYVNEEHFDEMFNLLVKGTYFTVQQLIPLINEGGKVIFNTSVATEIGIPAASVYSAAKSAVKSFTKTFARELLSKNIRVNAVSPGPIQTNIFDKSGMTPEKIQEAGAGFLSTIPLGRFGQASEVAKIVTLLASDDSSFMVGSEVYVDGGTVQL